MADAMTATTPATAADPFATSMAIATTVQRDAQDVSARQASAPSWMTQEQQAAYANGPAMGGNYSNVLLNGNSYDLSGLNKSQYDNVTGWSSLAANKTGQGQQNFDQWVRTSIGQANGDGGAGNTLPSAGNGGVAQATQTMRNVDPATETVAGQVAGIINQNSPLMQQARAGAMSAANDRGLINSSLAVGAGQNAVLNAATPIATSDANVYGNAANINTNTANSLAASNAAALNAARLQEQALAQDTAKSQLSANTQLSLGQLDAMTKSSIASGSNATQLATATLNSETQKSIAKLNAQTDTYKANLSAGTQTQVANIEANYKTLMQSSVLASQAMQDYTKNIYAIENNTNMDAATKQAAYDTEASNLKATMGVLGPINNLNLSSLLNFGSPAQVQAPTDTATAASTNSGPASFDSTG